MQPHSTARHRVGDLIQVVFPGAGYAYLATSPEALRELCRLSKARSAAQAGSLLGRLIEGGRVWVVPNGTQAIVVKNAWPMVQVRIIQGGLSGEVAWVPVEFAVRVPIYPAPVAV
jgi:hypothetical protein